MALSKMQRRVSANTMRAALVHTGRTIDVAIFDTHVGCGRLSEPQIQI